MPIKFPDAYLPPEANKWRRKVEETLQAIDRAASRVGNERDNSASSLRGTLGQLATQVTGLNNQQLTILDQQDKILSQQAQITGTQKTLSDQQAALSAVSQVKTAESTTVRNGFTGFLALARPTVTVTSASGRIKVDFGGSLNGGNGYFVFSAVNSSTGAVYVDRTDMFNNPAQRLAMSGGAAFIPSSFKSQLITVPAGATVDITLQYYAQDGNVYFFGGSISAQPLL